MIEPTAVFVFMAAAMSVLFAVGWLRRLVGMMGPD